MERMPHLNSRTGARLRPRHCRNVSRTSELGRMERRTGRDLRRLQIFRRAGSRVETGRSLSQSQSA